MLPSTSLNPQDRVLPLYFPGALVHFLVRHDFQAEHLLERSGLDPTALEEPEIRASFQTVRRIIRNCEQAWGRPDLGLHFGASLNILALGMVGQAAFASTTLGEALTTIARYLALRDPLLHYQIKSDEDSTTFALNGIMELGDVREFITQAAFAASKAFVKQLSGLENATHFKMRSERLPVDYAGFLGAHVTFGAADDCFSIEREFLDVPLETANPISAKEARQYCDAEMAQMGEAMRFGGVVRTLLHSRLSNIPTEDEAARILGHSARNLRRRLAAEKQTYRGLIRDVREQSAISMLQGSHRRIEDIAHELGYRNVGNFCRAFKRWTGQSPSAFRRD